ncbi:hypothetical protein BGW37DRAFT_277895 [Umbelopsis sp. PMI_123]|nr:hypothetical protein BGW37DRAFT_277895 [Umbelopsis sp. PMI_123]
MCILDHVTNNVTDDQRKLTHHYYKRLVDYGNRPFINPNFKWLIACVPIAIVIILMICLRTRKARLEMKGAQNQSESEYPNQLPPPGSDSEPVVNQGDGIEGTETRRIGSFGQTLPLWNVRSSSLSPIHSLPPPAYVRDPPDPPKYEDVIGPDDVPLAHCQSRLLGVPG